jgi:hypothetical protein
MRVCARAPDRATGKFEDMGLLQFFGVGSQNLRADAEGAPGHFGAPVSRAAWIGPHSLLQAVRSSRGFVLRTGPVSSVGQSRRLIISRSQVQVLYGAPEARNPADSGLLCSRYMVPTQRKPSAITPGRGSGGFTQVRLSGVATSHTGGRYVPVMDAKGRPEGWLHRTFSDGGPAFLARSSVACLPQAQCSL